MNCEICRREHSADLPFFCIVCARSTIYIPRLEAATVLLEKERLANQVEHILRNEQLRQPEKKPKTLSDASLAHTWSAAVRRNRKLQSKEKTQTIADKCQEQRQGIEQARQDIAARRTVIAQQKAGLETIKAILPDRRRMGAEKISDGNEKGLRTFDNLHKQTSSTRAFLCQEAAILLRFKQKKRKKDGIVRDQYYISGLPVADLRDISGLRCTELCASLSSLAHLLNLCSFYLSVRLPAEITAPHREYPRPTISTPANSYIDEKLPFPGTTAYSASPTPSGSKHGDGKTLPRPRPLFMIGEDEDDKVVQVARKDPASFAFFLEGLSLLAWDVAWLCRSQGFTSGTDKWEDVCNIGRNLWQLLLAPTQPAALVRVLSSRDVPDRQSNGRLVVSPATAMPKDVSGLGKYSHSSAHSFLGAPNIQDWIRSWKLAKYTMIADPLKKALWAEMNNAEWELLQEQEWDDGGEQFDEAVFIKTRLLDGHEFDDARSIMTARPEPAERSEPTNDGGDPARAKGTSGWTKVKSRDK